MPEDNQKKKTWLGIGVVLTVLLTVGMLAVSMIGPPDWLGPRGEVDRSVQMPPGTVQPYDPTRPVEVVYYQGERYQPSGEPLAMADAEFQVVGVTDDDQYALYSHGVSEQEGVVSPSDFEGGGAGGLPGLPQAEGGVFLRTADGKYQPLVHME